jgi:MFS family permease
VIFTIALSLGFSSFPTLSMNYFFKDVLLLDPTELSLFNSVINFVWILKPLFGFVCDSYPIFGSRRRAYLILFSLIGALSWVLLGTWVKNLWQAIVVKTMINISISFCNVIGEAIMVEASQK